MKKEYDLKKLKVKRRGPLPAFEGKSPDSAKIKITISLDREIVDYFKAEAEKPGAIPYQTQINQALIRLIEEHKTASDNKLETLKEKLLQDKDFIKRLSSSLKAKRK